MTDPLLTIDEATRAFRASAKTIRRRLAAGEIEGAYKRPGSRGPEWVMPEGALHAAGFAPRRDAPPNGLPEEPTALAAYWERRALDAEASLRAGPPSPAAPARARRHFGARPAVIGMLLLLLALGVAARQLDGGDGDDRGAGPTETSSGLVRALLTAQTDEGDRIGVIGPVSDAAVPDGRLAVDLGAATGADDRARFVVAVVEDEVVPPALGAVRRAGRVALDLPSGGIARLQVIDTSLPVRAGDATGRDEPDGGEGGSGRTGGVSGDVVEGARTNPGAATSAPPSATDHAAASGEVTVGHGDSFWSLAAAAVAADGSTADATVASYWRALVDANADRLVDPGNPDLLHVGQELVLPRRP